MRFVLDASALLALLLAEERGRAVELLLLESAIGSVNLSEAVAVMVRHGGDPATVRESLDVLPLTVLPLAASLAITAGLLWPATKRAGSSLGDRCALALARELDATLLTSDRRLSEIAPVVAVAVQLLQAPGAGSAR